MQIPHDEYKPYLIHRVECHYEPDRKGVMALCSYDYMGSAEFEFGAVGKALAVTRDLLSCGGPMVIAKVPLKTPVRVPVVVAGKETHTDYETIYALMGEYKLDVYDFPAFVDVVNRLVQEKCDTKETCYFNRNFAMWHDLENDIYFSYSEAWLRLVYSMLDRDRDFATDIQTKLKVGDPITIAKALNGKAMHNVSRLEIVEGKVAGILETGVVVKRFNKTYRMPFEYIVSNNLPPVYEHKENAQ
jgi:hypothetical protein